MTDQTPHDLRLPITSRRQLLKYAMATPLMAAGLTACGNDNNSASPSLTTPTPTPAPTPAKFVSAKFTPMAAPTLANPAEMATTTVNSFLSVSRDDGKTTNYALSYQPFFLTGNDVPSTTGGMIKAGGYFDIKNQPIIDKTVADKPRQFFSDSPDGTSLLTVAGADAAKLGVQGNPVFAVVQFEYTSTAQDGTTDMYGKLPSPIAVLTLDQDKTTGKLSLVKYHNVDTSSVNGLWITCGASLSPWGTHLSSEEYEPDAFAARDKNHMNAFSLNLYGDATKANPYHYGHLPEVTVNADGTGSIKKHYCLGRISHELVQVMPDNRTVLMGDDATNSGYFVFVADQEKDLSSGTLYVAKVGGSTDFSKTSSPAAPLTWIKLGSASSAEIRALVDGGIKPTDIMDVQPVTIPDPADKTKTIPNPQPSADHKKVVSNGKTEWVKVMAGKEKAAAFLETHRYAALVGGSLGFSKMEGTTVNVKDKMAYSALQNMQSSMVAGHAANVPGNGVSIPKQLVAGGIMALNLKGGQTDTAGAAINSEWMPVDIKPMLVGEDLLDADGKTLKGDSLGNTANPNMVANPDNLKFNETLRTLFIGEDSGQHVNNFLWAYNVDTKELARLISIPAGGESTGLHAVDNINGWTYIMSNFQHAGDWGSIHNVVKGTLDPLINANYNKKFSAAVGYLTASEVGIQLAK